MKLKNETTKPAYVFEKGIYKSCNPISKLCNLCLTENLEIFDNPDKNLLNKRSEIISQRRQKNKYKLSVKHDGRWHYLKKIPLYYKDFVTSVETEVIKLKIVKLLTWNSEYWNLVVFLAFFK